MLDCRHDANHLEPPARAGRDVARARGPRRRVRPGRSGRGGDGPRPEAAGLPVDGDRLGRDRGRALRGRRLLGHGQARLPPRQGGRPRAPGPGGCADRLRARVERPGRRGGAGARRRRGPGRGPRPGRGRGAGARPGPRAAGPGPSPPGGLRRAPGRRGRGLRPGGRRGPPGHPGPGPAGSGGRPPGQDGDRVAPRRHRHPPSRSGGRDGGDRDPEHAGHHDHDDLRPRGDQRRGEGGGGRDPRREGRPARDGDAGGAPRALVRGRGGRGGRERPPARGDGRGGARVQGQGAGEGRAARACGPASPATRRSSSGRRRTPSPSPSRRSSCAARRAASSRASSSARGRPRASCRWRPG